ncbi:MAG TPA: hypothetical protein DDY14_05325 [Chromatiaceae bacterium]|jgi:hypothetical protein|nr:hypothetical protein [Chromatiaceae bacterium]
MAGQVKEHNKTGENLVEIDRLSATLRPRSGWESVDLGFALARHWFSTLWLLWWITALPAAALSLLMLYDRPSLWLLAVWWLKPLYESLLLYWLSHALFGDTATLRETARQFPRAFSSRIWPRLLWRRFGLGRSFAMPVELLERLSRKPRRERLRVLGGGKDTAAWLTIICVHLETLLAWSAVLLIAFMIPDHLPGLDIEAAFFDDTSTPYFIGTLCMLIAMSVIAPFYVAAGFALYLGRRTDLEAWDLELRFRRSLAARQSRIRNRRRPQAIKSRAAGPGKMACAWLPTLWSGMLMALLLLAAGIVPEQVNAQASPATREQARTAIQQVLADDDFGSYRDKEVWHYIGGNRTPADTLSSDLPTGLLRVLNDLFELFGQLLAFLAYGLKWILMVAALAVLLLLLYHLLPRLGALDLRLRANMTKRKAEVASVSDGSAILQPLPDDLSSAVHALLASGDTRGALSLLYRAQIAHMRAKGIDIPDSATEADCVAVVAGTMASVQLDWLRQLTRLWQRVAYGHRSAGSDEIEHLLATHPAANKAASQTNGAL